ncbi:hypothetical protein SP19_132 [Salmonella phage 19]|nr:hypothetical protein SP19_132 [Salmonella phage 19]
MILVLFGMCIVNNFQSLLLAGLEGYEGNRCILYTLRRSFWLADEARIDYVKEDFYELAKV